MLNLWYVNKPLGVKSLSDCTKRKLKEHKFKPRSLVDNSVLLIAKKRILVKREGFLLPILTAVLPTVAILIF
jgi:hypothetical protein